MNKWSKEEWINIGYAIRAKYPDLFKFIEKRKGKSWSHKWRYIIAGGNPIISKYDNSNEFDSLPESRFVWNKGTDQNHELVLLNLGYDFAHLFPYLYNILKPRLEKLENKDYNIIVRGGDYYFEQKVIREANEKKEKLIAEGIARLNLSDKYFTPKQENQFLKPQHKNDLNKDNEMGL